MAAIIFDLDGTLADSFDYVSEFIAEQAGMAPLSDEQKLLLRGLSMHEMTRQLGYHTWEAVFLFFKGRRRMRHAIKHLESFEGMPELIRKLHAEGHELFILSVNSVRNIHTFLHKHKIHKYFLEIYGGVGMFGKAPALRTLLKEHKLDPKHAVYVGDEMRDIVAAQAAGLRSVAVSWGFAPRATLKAMKPMALADTTAELMSILEEL